MLRVVYKYEEKECVVFVGSTRDIRFSTFSLTQSHSLFLASVPHSFIYEKERIDHLLADWEI